jgi:hypothetical protein
MPTLPLDATIDEAADQVTFLFRELNDTKMESSEPKPT